MKLSTLKGYVFVVVAGLVALAAAVLVVLQWGRISELSLYGYEYRILVIDDKLKGGVNTALLMLLSAVGGVLVLLVARVLISGVRAIRRGRRQQAEQQTARRIESLEKSQKESAGDEK